MKTLNKINDVWTQLGGVSRAGQFCTAQDVILLVVMIGLGLTLAFLIKSIVI
jgi:hypothetical protein